MSPISFDRKQLHLYVITDRLLMAPRDETDAVAAAVEAGATMVQYREKHLPRKAMYEHALRLRDVTHAVGVPFVVNDFVDLALAVGADGVHLGQNDLPVEAARALAGERLWYGVSTHSVQQAQVAAQANPAYVAIGPVFTTATKTDPDPVVGLPGIRAVRTALPQVPLVGIGGITPSNAEAVRAAGADGVCVISAVWQAAHIAVACRALA